MPKHHLYPTPNPDESDVDRRVELHWQRDGGVQIATTVLPAASGAEPGTALDWDGQFVDLPRAQINHLIRYLRTARDQAYGRDE